MGNIELPKPCRIVPFKCWNIDPHRHLKKTYSLQNNHTVQTDISSSSNSNLFSGPWKLVDLTGGTAGGALLPGLLTLLEKVEMLMSSASPAFCFRLFLLRCHWRTVAARIARFRSARRPPANIVGPKPVAWEYKLG